MIINKTVQHIAFGEGKIVEYKDQKVTVAFDDCERVFQYPEAFEKFLKFADPSLQESASEELKNKTELQKAEKERKQRSLYNTEVIPEKKTKAPTIKRNKKGIKYKDWEQLYPEHVIIQKEGFMYQAHNESAEKIAEVLHYELVTDIAGRITTGGPDPTKMGLALEHANCSYIIVDEEQIVDQFDRK